LPHGMQELPRMALLSKSSADAARPDSGWAWRRVVRGIALSRSWRGPRRIVPSPVTPDRYRNCDPWRGHDENTPQKHPLQQQTRESQVSGTEQSNTGSRKHAVDTPTLLPPAGCSKGQV